jgi:hypothetical protein
MLLPDRAKHSPLLREAFFCFVFFVATKKMKLLSGNPDGFVFDFNFQSPTKRTTEKPSIVPSAMKSASL